MAIQSSSRCRSLPTLIVLAALAVASRLAPSAFGLFPFLVKPKAPPSAYKLWAQDIRAKIAEELGEGGAKEVRNALLLARWRNLTAAEKEEWTSRHEASMKEYEVRMAEFRAFFEAASTRLLPAPAAAAEGPSASTEKREAEEPAKGPTVPTTSAKKEATVATAPSAPKRPKAAYFLFCAEHRPRVTADLPGGNFTGVSAELGRRWKELPASCKKKYTDQTEKAMAQYKEDLARYEAAVAAPPSAPKKPPRSFFLFMAEHRARVTADLALAGEPPSAVMAELGRLWRELPARRKKKYTDMSEKLRVQYKEDLARYEAWLSEE